MSRSVIFLDIDGVLNHTVLYAENALRGPTPPVGWIDRACVARLDALCARTGAAVVISSGWRTYESIPGATQGGWRGATEVLRAAGLRAEVIGATPDSTRQVGGLSMADDRGLEILSWLCEHPEVERWVVLDDCDMGVDPGRFVRTSIAVGLTDADCERAVKILSTGGGHG